MDAADDDVMDLEDKSQQELDEVKKQYLDLAAGAQKEPDQRKAS